MWTLRSCKGPLRETSGSNIKIRRFHILRHGLTTSRNIASGARPNPEQAPAAESRLRDCAAKKKSGRLIPIHPSLRTARAQDDDRHRAGHPVRARRPDDAGQHRQLVRDCQSGRRPRAGSHPGVRRGPLSGVDLWRQRVGPNPPLVTHPGRRAKKHGAMQLGVTSQNGSLLGIWRGRPWCPRT
jgi:hypothetical protein